MTYFKIIIFICFVFFLNPTSAAQKLNKIPAPFYQNLNITNPDPVGKLKVRSIKITGNKKTKKYIILREMLFKEGDSLIISTLQEKLEQTRYLVYNLNLFSEVAITPEIVSAFECNVNVTVREKWFIYPTPQFQLIDRNVNEWLKTYNADWERVVYGIKFAHYNFSGRGDQLRIYLLNGYTRNVSFSYNTPFSNNKLTEGFSVSGGYSQNREIVYKTSDSNGLMLFKKPGFVRNNLFFSLSYQSRKGFFKRTSYSLSYTYVNLDDSIINPKYNPFYFDNNKSSLGIIDLSFSLGYTKVDNINYPLKGKIYGFTIHKRGLGLSGGINMLSISGSHSKYITHKKNWYSTAQLYSKIILPFTKAYINQRAIGYSEFYLRGLEYYVIDAAASAVAKYTFRKRLFGFNIPIPFHITAVPRIPFNFFAKTYADAGYGYIQKQFDTRLNNRLLYTCGFGIDLLTLYDAAINLEYSFNQLGENGIFLHAKIGF